MLEAKEKKANLTVLWLDLVNANGSIPHKLREFTLERYRILLTSKAILIEHFDKVNMSFTSRNFPTTWEGLFEGILTVCSVSEVLIAAAMYLIVKSVAKQRRGSLMSGIRQSLIRTFMDNSKKKPSW